VAHARIINGRKLGQQRLNTVGSGQTDRDKFSVEIYHGKIKDYFSARG
jgi:hypothetical protein